MKLEIIFVSMVLLLVGCKTVSKLDRRDEYKKAKPHDYSLILPRDINSSAIENHYPIPKTENGKRPAVSVSTVPPGCKL
jgi:uncharacterized lipoprotein